MADRQIIEAEGASERIIVEVVGGELWIEQGPEDPKRGADIIHIPSPAVALELAKALERLAKEMAL